MHPKVIFAIHCIVTAFLVLYAQEFLPAAAAETGRYLFGAGLALGVALLIWGPKSKSA